MSAAESKDAAIPCLEARPRGRRAVPEVCGGAAHTSGSQAFPHSGRIDIRVPARLHFLSLKIQEICGPTLE